MKLKQEHLMLAIKQAQKSNYMFRLGAVALHKGKVVSFTFNKAIADIRITRHGPSSYHAEAYACVKAKSRPIDTIIVVRINNSNSLSCSFPCKNCQNIMRIHGVKTVYYTDYSGNIQKFNLQRLNNHG